MYVYARPLRMVLICPETSVTIHLRCKAKIYRVTLTTILLTQSVSVPSALNFEELSTFQTLLYISARTVAGAGLFMKRQVKYVTSEYCGRKVKDISKWQTL